MTRMPKREKWGPTTFAGKLFSAFWKEHLSKEQQLRLGIKASRGPSQRHAMLRCPQSRIIADAIQSTGETRTLRYNVKNAFVLGDYTKEQFNSRELTSRELITRYEQKKKELKIAIKTAKRKCWQDFCEEVDSDPWG